MSASMTPRNITLSLDRSVGLLEGLFPDQHWASFLSNNRRGLTREFDPIPFDNASSAITYELRHLEEFAIKFSQDFDANEIGSHIDGFVTVLAICAAHTEGEDMLTSCGIAGCFPTLNEIVADASTRFSAEDMPDLLKTLQELTSEQRTLELSDPSSKATQDGKQS